MNICFPMILFYVVFSFLIKYHFSWKINSGYRFLNSIEAVGGAHWLAENAGSGNVSCWNDPLTALMIGIRQLGISGWKKEECDAIRNELLSWKEGGLPRNGIVFLFSFYFLIYFKLSLETYFNGACLSMFHNVSNHL